MKKISALAAALALVGAVGSANAQTQTGITTAFGTTGTVVVAGAALLAIGILSSSSSTPGTGS